jgi:hypothetical protein
LSEQDKEIRLVQDKYFELETLAEGNADALREIEIAKLNESIMAIGFERAEKKTDLPGRTKNREGKAVSKAARRVQRIIRSRLSGNSIKV